jgi:hypothetical protein
MLFERPFQREYADAQQASYRRNQQHFGVQSITEKLKQFPTEHFQLYHGVSEGQHQRWQPTFGCSTNVAVNSSGPSRHNINSTFGGPVQDDSMEFNILESLSVPKMKQEVFAFGPKHAEQARWFYQSTLTQPEFHPDVVPTFIPNNGSVQVPYIKQTQSCKESDLLGESDFKRTINNSTSYTDPFSHEVPLSVSSENEAVLKVAKISSRPDKKQAKDSKSSFFDFSENLSKNKIDQGTLKQSIDSEDIEDYIDLSNAPVFQILCEISKC